MAKIGRRRDGIIEVTTEPPFDYLRNILQECVDGFHRGGGKTIRVRHNDSTILVTAGEEGGVTVKDVTMRREIIDPDTGKVLGYEQVTDEERKEGTKFAQNGLRGISRK